MGSHQGEPLLARVDLCAMAIKEYSAFSRAATILEPHHQIVQDNSWKVLHLCRDAVGVFSSPSRQGHGVVAHV